MSRGYLLFGTLLCLGMAYANATGWIVVGSGGTRRTGPPGPRSGIHGFYHK